MYLSVNELGAAISRGDLDAGLVIPYDFARNLQRGQQATDVQILLNAMNANTAAIARATPKALSRATTKRCWRRADSRAVLAVLRRRRCQPPRTRSHLCRLSCLIPGLVTSWFIVTGMFGVLLILNGSLIASAAMIKEREAGTVEQLLMTPAGTAEIIIAKIAPLFLLLLLMMVLAATGADQVRFQHAVPRQLAAGLGGRRALRVVRHRYRNVYRDVHANPRSRRS